MLIEKVWAKLNGNYEQIASGLPEFAFNFFAGIPSLSLSNATQTAASYWTNL